MAALESCGFAPSLTYLHLAGLQESLVAYMGFTRVETAVQRTNYCPARSPRHSVFDEDGKDCTDYVVVGSILLEK